MLDILLDALIDTLKVMPFLYLSYLFIEYIEHKASAGLISGLYKVGRSGPLVGAALGVIPMCGLTVPTRMHACLSMSTTWWPPAKPTASTNL